MYPIEYTDDDKLVYDKFRKSNLLLYGGNPKDYELIILDISCKLTFLSRQVLVLSRICKGL